MARKNNRPTFKSATTIVGVNGTITKLISTVATTTAGAAINTHLSANGGIQSSLKNNLSVSANTIRMPKGPARLGPSRSCHSASIRRSTQINPAAILSSTNSTPRTIHICCIIVMIGNNLSFRNIATCITYHCYRYVGPTALLWLISFLQPTTYHLRPTTYRHPFPPIDPRHSRHSCRYQQNSFFNFTYYFHWKFIPVIGRPECKHGIA